jgi:hypothetical protein
VNLACQQAICPANSPTSLTGYVYDPSGNLPLYNAIVYVPNGMVEAFTPGIACEQCGASVSGQPLVITLTDTNGFFNLTQVPVGHDIPLVIQIGRWRRQVTVDVPTPCATAALDAGLTHMPQDHTQGDIPHIAISTGSADPFECLLLKMGIGAEIKEPGQGGRVDYYVQQEGHPAANNGVPISNNTPAGSGLWGSIQTLDTYDIVILPCEGAAYTQAAPGPQNLLDYVNDGGRLFTTHYGYQWLGPGYGVQPLPATASWCPQTGGTCPNTQNNTPPDPIDVSINTGFPKGQAFDAWLGGPQVNALNNGLFSITQSRYDVGLVNATAPDYVTPTAAWMFGDPNASWVAGQSTYSWTPHMTFNLPYNPPNLPDGDAGVQCGRVVYSDFHVTANDQIKNPATFPSECVPGQAYTAQEKALVFMLFDLASCIQSDATAPGTCGAIGGGCTANSPCCSGLACLDPGGNDCASGEGACTCSFLIQ